MTPKPRLSPEAIDSLFTNARSVNRFTDEPVADQKLRELYGVLRWGPTSQNSQPARYVFVRTAEGKQRLLPALSASNVEQTVSAPVTVIIAIDTRFYEFLPTQFRAYDAQRRYATNPRLAVEVAFRNGTLQGAYLILAARALGLDCGPMSGFDASKVDATFFADGRWRSNFLVNLGYGDPAGNHPPGPRLELEQVARFE